MKMDWLAELKKMLQGIEPRKGIATCSAFSAKGAKVFPVARD